MPAERSHIGQAKMDNDILINQARQLYADLLVRLAINESRQDRLERLISQAYCRYQRRLNRCVLCYQTRNYVCIREPGKKHTPCKRRATPRIAAVA